MSARMMWYATSFKKKNKKNSPPEGRHEENEPHSVGASYEHSRHGCAAAKDTGSPLQLHVEVWLLVSQPASGSLLLTLSAQWHGDFPRSVHGSDLPVRALRSRASPAPQS